LQVLEGVIIGLGINLAFNTTYLPQKDGKTERVNMILEDMFRMHEMHQQRRWESTFHWLSLLTTMGIMINLG